MQLQTNHCDRKSFCSQAHTASLATALLLLANCVILHIAQDTAGQERFNSMHPSYYYRAHACILVFDVTRKVTYQHLQEWYDELMQYRPGLPTLVVANKIDGQSGRERWQAGRRWRASGGSWLRNGQSRGGALVCARYRRELAAHYSARCPRS